MNPDHPPIDVEATPSQALAKVESGAVGKALTVDELHTQIQFIREVMRKEMKEGTDYGKIPGTGEKPTLLQPGADKLMLTFQLEVSVKKEVLREYPGMHREYEFTITITARNGRQWDGIGTCSTMEEKYRFRKMSRRCPACGKNTIIQGKAQFGGGWLCWAKKGGCGAKFDESEPKITSQPAGKVEHDNPADHWGTVRKMAFKRAKVSGVLNATNASELWTQDLEDTRGEPEETEEPNKPAAATVSHGTKQPTHHQPETEQDKADKPVLLHELRRKCDQFEPSLVRYLQNQKTPTGVILLMPNEGLEDLKVPVLRALIRKWDESYPKIEEWARQNPPKAEPPPSDESWRSVIVSVPRKGMKRDTYMKHPDTIGSLYELSHTDEEARKRLWGLCEHFEVETTWVNKEGKTVPRNEGQINDDRALRDGLDSFLDWRDGQQEQAELPTSVQAMSESDDSVPF